MAEAVITGLAEDHLSPTYLRTVRLPSNGSPWRPLVHVDDI
jgi:hypothetical protein